MTLKSQRTSETPSAIAGVSLLAYYDFATSANSGANCQAGSAGSAFTPNAVSAVQDSGAGVGSMRGVSGGHFDAAHSGIFGLGDNIGSGAFSFALAFQAPSREIGGTGTANLWQILRLRTDLNLYLYEINGAASTPGWYPHIGTSMLDWRDSQAVNCHFNSGDWGVILIGRDASGNFNTYLYNATRGVGPVLAKSGSGFTATLSNSTSMSSYVGCQNYLTGFAVGDLLVMSALPTSPLSVLGDFYGNWPNNAPAPTVSISSPSAGAVVGGNFTVSGTVENWVSGTVDLSLDGGASWPYTGIPVSSSAWTSSLTAVSPGSKSMVARSSGNTSITSSAVAVTVASQYVAIAANVQPIFQRDTVTGLATISLSGTYIGSPSGMEWSWNGSAYTSSGLTFSGGAWSLSVANQAVGQGNLTVRFVGDPTIYDTRLIGVGDIFVVAGQSNHVGQGNTYVVPSGAMVPCQFDSDGNWRQLTETPSHPFTYHTGSLYPTIYGATNGNASCFGQLSNLISQAGVPVGFVPCAVGSTSISVWNSDATLTTTLMGAMVTRANALIGGKHRAVLFWQGEADVNDAAMIAETGTNYKAYLSAAIAKYRASATSPAPWIIHRISDQGLTASRTPIITQQAEYITATANAAIAVMGADMGPTHQSGVSAWTSGNIHYGYSTVEIGTVAQREYDAIAAVTGYVIPQSVSVAGGTGTGIGSGSGGSLSVGVSLSGGEGSSAGAGSGGNISTGATMQGGTGTGAGSGAGGGVDTFSVTDAPGGSGAGESFGSGGGVQTGSSIGGGTGDGAGAGTGGGVAASSSVPSGTGSGAGTGSGGGVTTVSPPFSLPTCRVKVTVERADGDPASSAVVRAKLDRVDFFHSVVAPSIVTETTDEWGQATLALWPNELGSTGSRYMVQITGPGISSPATFSISVPDVTEADMDSLVVSG